MSLVLSYRKSVSKPTANLRDREEMDFTIWLTNALSGIVTLSGAKGLAARFFASLRMTLV